MTKTAEKLADTVWWFVVALVVGIPCAVALFAVVTNAPALVAGPSAAIIGINVADRVLHRRKTVD